jgi:hypothetical protein
LAEIYLFSLRDSMTPDQLAELKTDATLRMRLAKRMARDCFRNTPKLEEMHVMHQIDNEEMKALMIDAVDYCYDFLMHLCSSHGAETIAALKEHDELSEWNDPVSTGLGGGPTQNPRAARRPPA